MSTNETPLNLMTYIIHVLQIGILKAIMALQDTRHRVRDTVKRTTAVNDIDTSNQSVVHNTYNVDPVLSTAASVSGEIPALRAEGGECDINKPFSDAITSSKYTVLCHKEPLDTKYGCGVCGERFKKNCQCSTHLKTHSDHELHELSVSKGTGKFPCNVCGCIFNTNKRVREHQRMHTGERSFTCDICDKSFNRQDRLKIHKRYHTGERPYQCPHCDKKFTENSTLFRHIATHDDTDERPFSCDQCEKSFRRKFQLQAHLSAHLGQKKNRCNHCHKCFAAPSLLKEHMRTHSGEKPFSCPVCNKHFRNQAHVKRHMATHTKPRPFQCVECDRTFGLQVRLENHIHRTGHTGNNQFACPHCNRTFKKNSNYSNHIKRHNNSEVHTPTTGKAEDQFTIDEAQSSANAVALSDPQLAEAVITDSAIITQNDSVIQMLICANEGNVIENVTLSDSDNQILATNRPNIYTYSDGKQNESIPAGNFENNLNTVVILLQNGMEDSVLTEASETIIQTEMLEESTQLVDMSQGSF